MGLMLRIVLAVAFLCCGSHAGRAAADGEAAAALQRLAGGGFEDKLGAIDALAISGHERAADVLEAILAGRLALVRGDDRVVITEPMGGVMRLIDPLTGSDLGEARPDTVAPLLINNRLRAAIRGALGGLTLLSRDAAKRRAGADAVFKTRDPGLRPVLEKTLARETDAGIKRRLERALAAMNAVDASAAVADRLGAIATLASFPDPEVGSLLAALTDTEADPAVRAAAAAAKEKVDARLRLWSAVSSLFQGISLGSVLLLAAVGLAITFGVMGVINMAHGEMVMLGAYTTFVVQDLFRTHAAAWFDWSLAVALPGAFVIAGLVGIMIERGVIRFLYGRPLETLLATWGVSLILQQAVRSVFGPSNREVGNPSWMSGAIEIVGGLTLTYNRLWIFLFSLLVFAGLILLIRHSFFGLTMRAVTQNRRMAGSMGIRTGRVDALTFGLGSGIAGIAGVALSQIDNVSPNLGQSYIIDSFLVVVFGGVGNLWGTLVGAISLGLINKLLEPFAGAVLGKILVLVAIILFIQKRPRGLFALKGRAIET